MPPAKKKPSPTLARVVPGTPDDKKLDVLRALVLNLGSLWRSELVNELSSLCAFKKVPVMNDAEIDAALVKLVSDGAIKVEAMIKAAYPESKDDKLISLADVRVTSRALSKDKVLSSYSQFLACPSKKTKPRPAKR